jgi:hypothetical protein
VHVEFSGGKARSGQKIVLDVAPLETGWTARKLLSKHADAVVEEAAPDQGADTL